MSRAFPKIETIERKSSTYDKQSRSTYHSSRRLKTLSKQKFNVSKKK